MHGISSGNHVHLPIGQVVSSLLSSEALLKFPAFRVSSTDKSFLKAIIVAQWLNPKFFPSLLLGTEGAYVTVVTSDIFCFSYYFPYVAVASLPPVAPTELMIVCPCSFSFLVVD